MIMKILVTGAAGFVGSNVIEYLLANHTEIEIIATSKNSEKAQQMSWFNNVTFIPLDYHNGYNDGDNLFEYFKSPDLMIHLAWAFLPKFKATEHLEIELPAQYRFLTNLLSNGLKDLTCVGTCYEYGLIEGELSENTTCKPFVPYALAKLELMNKLFEYQKKQIFNFNWLRLFFMYGPGQSEKSILPQLEKAIVNKEEIFNMSKGEQVRDYLPIQIISANISKVALKKSNNGIINCSSNIPITVKQLVEDYIQKRNTTIKLNLGFYPYPDYEPFKFWGNNSKLNSIINN